MACTQFAPNAWICRPDGKKQKTKPFHKRWRWCFECRQYAWYRQWVFIPKPYSYYEPNYWWECSQCHKEADLGFGWEYQTGE